MKSRFSFLPLVAAVLAVLVSLPVASVVVNIFQPDKEDVWAHLAETVLAEYVFNSLALAAGAGLGAALLGTGAAWIVAMYRFPGRRLMPAKTRAFIDMLESSLTEAKTEK